MKKPEITDKIREHCAKLQHWVTFTEKKQKKSILDWLLTKLLKVSQVKKVLLLI